MVLKATGPALIGDKRRLPSWLGSSAELFPRLILAVLVATQTFSEGRHLVLDARAAGLAVAALAVVLRAPIPIVLLVAVATTAAVRLIA
jgi:hypothetical protein